MTVVIVEGDFAGRSPFDLGVDADAIENRLDEVAAGSIPEPFDVVGLGHAETDGQAVTVMA